LNNQNSPNIAAIILTVGLSSRMGAYKPLLTYKGKSFFQNIVLKLNSVCDRIIIVTGFHPQDIEINIKQLKNEKINSKSQFVFNENFEDGMFSSLQKGIGACSEADWILYHFVDQPSLPVDFYNSFVQQIEEEYDWIQPVINEGRGHPVLLGNKMKEKILSANVDSSLKDLSRMEINKKYWQCNFKQIFDDIDNINDYKVLLDSDK